MKKFYIFIFSIIWFIFGCDQTIEIEVPPHQPKLVVNSVTSTDSLFIFSISKSRGILDPTEKDYYIKDAQIKLYEDEKLVETLNEWQLDVFERVVYKSSGIKSTVNKEFRIKVSAPNFDMVTSREIVPSKITIKDIELNLDESNRIKRDEGYFYPLYITFSDPTDENYYFVQVRKRMVIRNNDELIKYESFIMLDSDDPLLQSENNHNYNIEHLYLMNDVGFNGKESAKVRLLASAWIFDGHHENVESSEIQVVIKHVSKSYYNFMKGKILQNETDGNPFAEPVQVVNNIQGGYGIFGLYTTNVFTKKLK